MPRNRSIDFAFSDDGCVLSAATRIACLRVNATTDLERENVADSILWLAQSGYARHSDGTLDAAVLADAAITIGGVPKYRSSRRAFVENEYA